MKNKRSGYCFLCCKPVPKGKGYIIKEVKLKLLCANCYNDCGYRKKEEEKEAIRKERQRKKEEYIQSMWWNK